MWFLIRDRVALHFFRWFWRTFDLHQLWAFAFSSSGRVVLYSTVLYELKNFRSDICFHCKSTLQIWVLNNQPATTAEQCRTATGHWPARPGYRPAWSNHFLADFCQGTSLFRDRRTPRIPSNPLSPLGRTQRPSFNYCFKISGEIC
jgi:hypothetical protein